MSKQPVTSQQYFFALTILHFSLMSGMIIIGGMFYFFNFNATTVTGVEAAGQPWVYIAGGVAIAGVLISALLFNSRLTVVQQLPDLNQKLQGYRQILILRWVLLEIPALLSLFGYFQTGNVLLFIFPALILLLLIMYRPAKAKTIQDLNLGLTDQNIINDPNAIVTEMEISND